MFWSHVYIKSHGVVQVRSYMYMYKCGVVQVRSYMYKCGEVQALGILVSKSSKLASEARPPLSWGHSRGWWQSHSSSQRWRHTSRWRGAAVRSLDTETGDTVHYLLANYSTMSCTSSQLRVSHRWPSALGSNTKHVHV